MINDLDQDNKIVPEPFDQGISCNLAAGFCLVSLASDGIQRSQLLKAPQHPGLLMQHLLTIWCIVKVTDQIAWQGFLSASTCVTLPLTAPILKDVGSQLRGMAAYW